jgi:hypothetical protein
MPSGLGKAIRKAQMDWFFQGAAATAPTDLYISLHTGDPLDDGSGANEVSGSSYARIHMIVGSTNWNAGTSPSNDAPTIVTNKLAIVSPTATGSWGTVTFFGLWSAITAGTFYGRGPISPGQVVTTGQFVTIPIGSASFTNNSS